MSRSGYSDDGDSEQWAMICWSGAVKSAMRGKRGQAFLRELIAALDALPGKALIAESLQEDASPGEVCALGSVGLARGMDMSKLDPADWDQVAGAFKIAPALAREIMYYNDDWHSKDTPVQRWIRMRAWAASYCL